MKFRISRSAEPCVPGGPVVERWELVGKWWIYGDCVVVWVFFLEILWVGGWPAFFFCAKIPLWWWNIALTDEMWRWVKIWNFEQIAFGQFFCPGNKNICFLNVHFIVSKKLDSIFVVFFFFLSPHLSLILVGYSPILVGCHWSFGLGPNQLARGTR